MSFVLATAFWEISLIVLSVIVLSAVSITLMIASLKGIGMLNSKNRRAPPEEIETTEKKEP